MLSPSVSPVQAPALSSMAARRRRSPRRWQASSRKFRARRRRDLSPTCRMPPAVMRLLKRFRRPTYSSTMSAFYEQKPFFDIPDDDWERFFQVNVMSGVRLTRGYMKGMLERNWGRILFLSSESGVNIPDDMLHYGFTKTAVLALSRGLAKLARGTGVTVNAVLPGPTMSAGVERMLKGAAEKSGKTIEQVGAEFVKTKRATSIIQRIASAEEVANMVVYACSPQASATTGAALRVEGGIVEAIA